MDVAFALVRAADRVTTRALVRRLTFDAADPRLAERIATIVAAMAPQLSFERLDLLARYSLWCVALDDMLDEPAADLRSLPYDGFSLLYEFQRYVRHAELITAALQDAVRASAELAAAPRPLSFVDYLALASRDVNYRAFAYALALLVGSDLDPDALTRIDLALWSGARAVRLANDLRSAPRDAAAGRPDALRLRHRNGMRVTAGDVSERIRIERVRHDEQLGHTRAEEALRHSLDVTLGIYETGDLR